MYSFPVKAFVSILLSLKIYEGTKIATSILNNNWILLLILLFALFVAVLVTFFIAQRVGKAISEKYKRWVYLLISLLPLKELFELISKDGIQLSNLYFWFWTVFWIYCLLMFLRLGKLTESRQEDAL